MADIKVQNLYYMLSYAYQALREAGFDNVAHENFENIHDLLAAILIQGVGMQIKRGLHRDYVPQRKELAGVRGRILVGESIKRQSQIRSKLICAFDEFTPDSEHNRVLKSIMLLLMRESKVRQDNQKALRKLLLYFGNVLDIQPSAIRFDTLQYHRNNADYRMLIGICRFIIKGLLLTTQSGEHRLATWVQTEEMSRLYERFILAYYQQHNADLSPKAARINWDVNDDANRTFLPTMLTDIVLTGRDKTLIIDAKYYSSGIMAIHYDKHSYRSAHIYQMYAYVKNLAGQSDSRVSGVLLYAKTDEELPPAEEFYFGGNKISIQALDLNCEWADIKQQLNALAATLS